MKFSIRGLLFVTVALASALAVSLLALAVEHNRHSLACQKLELLGIEASKEGYSVEYTTVSVGPFTTGVRVRLRMLNSSAPAPNPPKP